MENARAIIVAAGRSRRMGFDKLFADLIGRPVVAWSVAAFEQCPAIDEIVLVGPEDPRAFEELRERENWQKVTAVVPGGAERHLSVARGLAALGGTQPDGLVAIHDGARPLITPELIAKCLARAAVTGAACCAAPVADTVKRANGDLEVSESVEREGLWAMQTPQVFRRELIERAYAAILASGEKVTDEVSAVQRLGEPVSLVAHEECNLKITFPRDLEMASHLLNGRAALSR